jgi:autotransporter strand-loop-strand O-heptosyltransferase
MKVRAHTCYIGRTGYAAHARGFFRELSKYVDLRVRNYTWDANPHYLNETDLQILEKITLSGKDGEKDWPIKEAANWYEGWKNLRFQDHDQNWEPDVDIVLMEQDHFYFYHDYKAKIKIAYMVWESTEMTQSFFDRILYHFDYFMVVSEWHKEMAIAQGYPESRIIVVPEGVDKEFTPSNSIQKNDVFQFLFFGRWDYRKAVPEILKSVLDEFKDDKFELILSADNPYSVDGLNTTEERLEKYGLLDDRIKIQHFLDRPAYLDYMKNGNVLITCARSEGWNIPLIEALASGIPVTYSDWGAQLEFAKGLGSPVKIEKELPANIGADLGFSGNIPGYYCEPDYNDLRNVLRNIYENWEEKKEKALDDAKNIRDRYDWEVIGKIGFEKLISLEPQLKPNPKIIVSFLDGPKVEILDKIKHKYIVQFINRDDCSTCPDDSKVKYSCVLENNQWAACGIKYFMLWRIKVKDYYSGEVIYQYDFDPTGKKIYMSIESSSLGDSIAWMSPVEEFRKKWNCEVHLSTFRNELFASRYPEIHFYNRGESVPGPYSCYRLGWFYGEDGKFNANYNPSNFREIPMQKAVTDILSLEYKEIKTLIHIKEEPASIKGDYVCIGIHGTAQSKYWNNPEGWQKLVDWLNAMGYQVVLISKESTGYMGNFHPRGIIDKSGDYPLDDRINDLKHSKAFIGIGSGLSWLAWATGTPVVMISGFSEEYSEFECVRVINKSVCHGCFNRYKLDAGDWNWCPDHKGTPRQFECTKNISHSDVIDVIQKSNILDLKRSDDTFVYKNSKFRARFYKTPNKLLSIERLEGKDEMFFYVKTSNSKKLISIGNIGSSIFINDFQEYGKIQILNQDDVMIFEVLNSPYDGTAPQLPAYFNMEGEVKIVVEGIKENRIHYYIVSKTTPRSIRIIIDDSGKIFYDNLSQLLPNVSYWTQPPVGLLDPKITFIDEETGKILHFQKINE